MSLVNIKEKFPLLMAPQNKDLAYLDNGASAQKPAVVLQAMDRVYQTIYANVHRGLYRLAEAVTAEYEQAREQVAQYLNAREAAEIVFTKNATAALNLAAASLSQLLKPGDRVVLTELEHHANLVPWQQAAIKYKLELKYLPITDEGRLDLSQLDQYITKGTKIVGVSALSNVLGTVTELDQVIKRAKEVGARVIVDAAQAMQHEKIDVQALGCDALAFSGHKLFGPTGVGVLYGRREMLEQMPPVEFGGHMISEVDWFKSSWAEIPTKFEPGTPAIVEVIGLAEALRFVDSIGWDDIKSREAELTAYGLEQLLAIPNLRLIGPQTADKRAPIFAFVVSGIHAHDLAGVLDSVGVAVRSGHHCAQTLHKRFGLAATTRASLAFYNTKEEIDRLVKGIQKAQQLFK